MQRFKGGYYSAYLCKTNFKQIKIMVTIGNDKYRTVHELAQYKGVTIQTVYNWIADKKVETRKFLNMTLVKD